MADVIMPQMGESIAEGTVTKWMKNVGDRVERDEPLFEISTDKVDAEIPSPAAGILKEIRVAAGTTVAVNTVVGVIAAEGEAAAAAAERPSANAEPPLLAANVAAPAPAAARCPRCARPRRAAGARGAAGRLPDRGRAPPVLHPHPAAAASTLTAPAEPEAATEKPRSEMTADELRLTRSSPVVRKIAAEHQLDIREIPGTGIGGRVTKQDILGVIEHKAVPAGAPAAQADGAPGTPAAPGAAGPAAPRPARACRSCRCRRSGARRPSTWCSRSAPRPTSRPCSRST